MVPPPQTVLIFDLDNTLIHSTIDFLGLRHRLIDMLISRGSAPAPRGALMREPIPHLVAMGEEAAEDLGRAMWDEVAAAEQAGLRGAQPDAQVSEVLAGLRARGYRLAVLTNNARDGVMAKLEEFGLAAYFDVIATRSDVAALKPSPAGITYVLERLPGVHAAVLIGDAWIDGVAAREAGIPFVGVGPKQRTAEERGVQAVAWVGELRELLSLDLTRGG